ncbi:11843_t:CDS:2, partial [Ambispora leptoticha]
VQFDDPNLTYQNDLDEFNVFNVIILSAGLHEHFELGPILYSGQVISVRSFLVDLHIPPGHLVQFFTPVQLGLFWFMCSIGLL